MATQTASAPDKAKDSVQQLEDAEQQAVLQAFAELKRRDHGELRIAIRLNKSTGVREIVYIGVHEQQNLDRLRKLYQSLTARNGARPITF